MFKSKSSTDDFPNLFLHDDESLGDTGPKKKKAKGEKKLPVMNSTQSFSRVVDIKDGIIITSNREYVCIVEVAPINFGLMDEDERNVVIGQFEGALAVLPRNVQIKCLARKQNVGQRVNRMMEHLKDEPNPTCRSMLLEQVDLIEQMAYSYGISRRFFVVFKYEPEDDEGGFFINPSRGTPEWDVIRSQLHRRREQFEYKVGNCGNKIISKAYNNDYILATLYDILHPYSTDDSYVTLEDKVQMVYANHGISPGDELYVSPNDILAYNTLNTKHPNYIVADGVYYAFAYVPSRSYGERAYPGWISKLVNLGEGIDLDIFLTKDNKALAKQKLTYTIRAKQLQNNDTDSASTEKDEIEKQINSGYYLKAKLSNDSDEFCYLSCLLTVTASSEEQIKDLITRVRRVCRSIEMPVSFCRYQQIAAFQSVMPPLCKLDPNIYKLSRRNLMMSDAASIYPFLSFNLDDPDGVLYGQNKSSGGLVIVDNFNADRYPNGNMIIVGTPGAGKTYTMASLCLRFREMGVQTFIISPAKGFEFRQAAEGIGGERVRIWPGSPDTINVMEIRKHDNTMLLALDGEEESLLTKKIQSLHTFVGLLLPDITVEEKEVLDRALVSCYGKFGITEDNASLEVAGMPGVYKRMPIIGDLYNELQLMGTEAKRLAAVLSQFVTGSASSFNRPTNVDLDNSFIAFDVSEAKDDFKALCMFIATDLIWDKVQEDRTRKKVIALDEVWQLVGASASDQVSQFVLDIFKLIRGFGGIGIAATQDISDFFGDAHGRGKAIVNACELKCILKLKKHEADFARQVIEINDADAREIVTKFNRGDMLLMAGNENVFLHVQANPTEHRLISTQRSDLEKRAKATIAAQSAASGSQKILK